MNSSIAKVFSRFLTNSHDGTLSNITTGRSDITIFYLKNSFRNILTVLFGKGINYLHFYSNYGIKYVAHNTYMDFYLSWGITGVTLFFLMFLKTCILKTYVNNKYKIQLIIFLLFLFSLSCMTTDMFWLLLAFIFMNSNEEEGKNDFNNNSSI